MTVPKHLTSNLTRSVRPLPPLWFLLLAAANMAGAQPTNTTGAQSERYRDFIRKGATRSAQDLDHDGQEAAAEGKNILVDTSSQNAFSIDATAEAGFALADLIHGFSKSEQNKIVMNRIVNGTNYLANGGLAFKYDKDSDWNGDGTKDTIIYITEAGVDHTLAILNNVSVELVIGDFLGSVGTVTEEGLRLLPDIA